MVVVAVQLKEVSANFSKKQLLRTDPVSQENESLIQPIEGQYW